MREEWYGRERKREVSESFPGQGRRDTYFDVSPQLSLPLRRLCCCQIHRKRKCCFSSLALLFSLSLSRARTRLHIHTLSFSSIIFISFLIRLQVVSDIYRICEDGIIGEQEKTKFRDVGELCLHLEKANEVCQCGESV